MYPILSDLRVVEGASFAVGPLCGLALQQLGAEVIRFDMIGGGPDFHRWPRAPKGKASLYWEGLNKGKKSIAIDLSSPEGKELAVAIVTAPGDGAGLFVTNYPSSSFLSHHTLAELRADLITVRIIGWADERTAVDYTVNAAVGVSLMTGPENGAEPVSYAIPAWDAAAANYAALALLVAERRRAKSSKGAEIKIALGDIALSALGNFGYVADATLSSTPRARTGNNVPGAFGRDFLTADGRRLIVVALTKGQWRALVDSLGIQANVAALEKQIGVDFSSDAVLRFEHREKLNNIVANAVAKMPFNVLAETFEQARVCWSPYNRLDEIIGAGRMISEDNPLFARIDQPSGHAYLAPGSPAHFSDLSRAIPQRAPHLGEHTDEILSRILGLSSHEIGRLHDRRVVASADAAAG